MNRIAGDLNPRSFNRLANCWRRGCWLICCVRTQAIGHSSLGQVFLSQMVVIDGSRMSTMGLDEVMILPSSSFIDVVVVDEQKVSQDIHLPLLLKATHCSLPW